MAKSGAISAVRWMQREAGGARERVKGVKWYRKTQKQGQLSRNERDVDLKVELQGLGSNVMSY
jgi:hypothetical protein